LDFIIAGLVLIAIGINFGDTLTIVGKLIRVISCLIWMTPFLKSKRQ